MVSRLWGSAMGPPLPLFKVHCAVGLRCKLGKEGSWECLARSKVGTCNPSTPPRKTWWAKSLLDPDWGLS